MSGFFVQPTSSSYAIQPATSSYTVSQNSAVPAVTLDTPYTKLHATVKEEIDSVYSKFKNPSREYLAEIAAQDEGFLSDISERLRAANLLLLRNENKQVLVRNDLFALRDDAMQLSIEARKSGHSSLEEIRQYGNGRMRKSDQASRFQANDFFLASFARLAHRLEVFAEEASRIEKQIISMQLIANKKRESLQDVGIYGEAPKIGLHEIMQLIKAQHEAFLAVTARIAECHRDADLLRAAFKKCFPAYANVFEDEDRRESADGRISALRVKEQFREHLMLESRSKASSSGSNGGGSGNNQQSGGANNPFYAPIGTANKSTPTAAAPSNFGLNFGGSIGQQTTSVLGGNAFSGLSNTATASTSATGQSSFLGSFGGQQAAAPTTAPAAGSFTAGFTVGPQPTTAVAPTTGGFFGATQPNTAAGDLAGVTGLSRNFSSTFGNNSSTTSNSSKSKNRKR